MPAPVDVSDALRSVYEVRKAEERLEYCTGGWMNVVWGTYTAFVFGLYALVSVLGVASPWVERWLWLPPLLVAYAAIVHITTRRLGLPRRLPLRNLAAGTALFVVLFGLLGLAFQRGVITDYAAGVSVVIGAFYVILGVAWLREPAPALFGAAIAAGAIALLLLDAGYALSTLYGIVVTGGGMIGTGLWMLRGSGRWPGPSTGGGAEPPGELQEVRETLERLRGHEGRVLARERAFRTYLVASVFALAGVVGFTTGAHPAPLALLAIAGFCVALGAWRQRSGGRHAA